MTPATAEQYQSVIANAPGPAPWYLSQPASDLSTPNLQLTWVRDSNPGPSQLTNSNREIYALTSMNTYVRRVSPTQFVVWHKSDKPKSGVIRFLLYDISLIPMNEEQLRSARLRQIPFAAATPPLAEHTIPQNQALGSGTTTFPPEFVNCPELFVLVSGGNGRDDVRLNLWIIEPITQTIQVVSQDWFTHGSYDFGYQWITRMARDSESKHIVGDGIRIGRFVLNEDATKFLGWLDPTINS